MPRKAQLQTESVERPHSIQNRYCVVIQKRSSVSKCLESVILERMHQVFNTSLVRAASLHEKSGSGKHGKASVGNFLCLKTGKLGGITLLESKWVQVKVTWGAVSAFTSTGSSNSANHLGNGDHDKGESDVLWVGVPQLPERVHLALSSGSLASWGRSEDLNLEDTSNSKHGNTAMLELGLTEPVKVDSDIINVGKSKWVETDITSH
mmetsp:Transcript_29751/g.49091  ORF Transcript_29751/g.49091 Transcript_29751/m.49091 type:complete len:207 (+) Transcript_29751:65-685(+)